MTTTPITRAALEALDRDDPLRDFRARFELPADTIYLDGNSLGALPRDTAPRLQKLIAQEWGGSLIGGWSGIDGGHGWVDLPQRLGDRIGRLIGARLGETLACDSTSVNLYKLLSAALDLRPQRRVILSETGNFPTDLYVAQGLVQQHGGRHQLRCVGADAIDAALDEDVAVLMLSHVNFATGRMHDLAALTARAHAVGALVLWDLAHSAGAVPLDLTGADSDFAVGCGYKYLNGGPGAPAFLHVAQRLQAQVHTPVSGWFGHAQPFAFRGEYTPAPGVSRMLAGTPPVLGMTALEVGVDLMLEAPMAALRGKSLQQTDLFMRLVEQELGDEFGIVTPREPRQRGSQVCLRHAQAWPLAQALIAQGVIGDFRAPDILRFGFAPLYGRYAELWDAVAVLKRLVQTRGWDRTEFHARRTVT